VVGEGADIWLWPAIHQNSRSVRYSLQALEEFKRANARGSTSEYERCAGPGRPAKQKSGAAV